MKILGTPKVSIIVPVYNTDKYLKQCIDSLTSQTLKEIEIVIVDDGSKEECAKLCDELAEKDARIKVVHKVNGGLGFARNTGIENSCGEYVGFVDSDDYVDVSMFQALYDAAAKYDADLVISGITFVDGNTFGKTGEYIEKNYFENDTVFENNEIKKLLLGVVGALPNEPDDSRYGVSVCKNIFKRALFEEKNIRFFSEREIISEDTLFMVDYIKEVKKAVGIKGAFYRYRRNDESLSKSYKPNRFEKILVFLKELELHIKDSFKKEEYQLYLDRLTQGYARISCSQEILNAKYKKIKYKELRKRLKTICNNQMIVDSLKKYPWYKLPKKQAAFAGAMKYKLYFLQKLMVLLRAR